MNKISNLIGIYLIAGCVLLSANNCKTEKKESPSVTLSQVLDSVNRDILQGEYGFIDRFMVVRNNEVIADYTYKQDYETVAKQYDTTNHQYNYHHPNWHPFYQGSELHSLQSVTKSINSILLGIALEENTAYSINSKLMDFLPEYADVNNDSRINEISLEDLLSMRSGFQWNEGEYNDLTDDCIAMEASEDWIKYVLSKPFDSDPGKKWTYNSGVSVLIGKVLSVITGKKADAYAEDVLFKPLAIETYYWKKTPKGEIDTEGGLYLKAEDLAKFGKLFLDGGKWNDIQVVPEKWVTASTQPLAKNLWPEEAVDVGYGYQWWTEEYDDGALNLYSANGYGGQFLMVVPQYDLYVVFNGWNTDNKPEKSSFFVLTQRILPIIKNNP